MGKHWANHNVCFSPAIGWEDLPGCSTQGGCKGEFGKETVATKGKSLTKKYIYQILYFHVTTKSSSKNVYFLFFFLSSTTTTLDNLLETPANFAVILQNKSTQPLMVLMSLQRKQSFPLGQHRKICVVSTQFMQEVASTNAWVTDQL